MSYTFYIKQPKKWFSNQVLKVSELLALVNHLETFQPYFDRQQYNDEDTLDKRHFLQLGIFEVTARGFELFYTKKENENYYEVKLATPSSIQDWETAIQFMIALAKKLKQNIMDEENNVYTIDTIKQFDYISNIQYGIENLFKLEQPFKDDIVYLPGQKRQIAISKEKMHSILESENPVQTFSDFIYEIQHIEGYDAKQILLQNKDQSYVGAYILTANIKTILPFSPILHYQYYHILTHQQVAQWWIQFMDVHPQTNQPEPIGRMDYHDFIQLVPKEKYQFIDAAQIRIQLSCSEIQSILKQKNA